MIFPTSMIFSSEVIFGFFWDIISKVEWFPLIKSDKFRGKIIGTLGDFLKIIFWKSGRKMNKAGLENMKSLQRFILEA